MADRSGLKDVVKDKINVVVEGGIREITLVNVLLIEGLAGNLFSVSSVTSKRYSLSTFIKTTALFERKDRSFPEGKFMMMESIGLTSDCLPSKGNEHMQLP